MTGHHLVQAAAAAGSVLGVVLPVLGAWWLAERWRDRRNTP